MGSTVGARTTVQRFMLISLAEEYSRTLSSFEVNEDDCTGKGSIVVVPDS